MELLERQPILAELDALLAEAATGAGRIAAIAGEAGVGKTSLVERFLQASEGRARTLRGLCDPLSTPRPLGPLHDMAAQSVGPLAAALADAAGREALFSAFLAELGRPLAPVVVVVEDVHWADGATLDLLRFVARRVRRLPALLLVTYRDDEVGPDHELHHLLGQLPPAAVRWLPLPLLSPAAVREMARSSGRPDDGVHALTGGNPFFVTEVLASRAAAVPASIREALLARAARLSPGARELLDLVGVVPGRAERWLLDALLGRAPALTRECVASGVLVTTADGASFRHELARRAWQETLDAGAVRGLHARVLRVLLDRAGTGGDLARVVHHADGAGDAERVLHFAPAAAREAAALGAHRQAASHYATALRHAGALAAPARAALLEAFAYERYLVDGIADALRARGEALTLRRALDDRRGEGTNLRWLSRLAWFEDRRADAVSLGEQAIAVLEPLGPTPDLAMAYSNLAQLCMLADDCPGATGWGERAIAMAEQLGDTETLTHALTNVGAAELFTARRAAGLRRLAQSVDLALRSGFHEHAVRAYTTIARTSVRTRDYAQAALDIERTRRFAAEHEIDTFELFILGWRARLELERGSWEAAERDALAALRGHNTPALTRCQPLVVLALLRARRGEAGVDAILDEALSFAIPTGELQRIGPAAAARAETAWLRGALEDVRAELRAACEIVRQSADRWGRAQLAWWLRRAGDPTIATDDLPEPYARQLAGDWRGAAAAWEAIGAPYERALALADGDAPEAWRDALAGLEALGATGAAAAVRRDLRQRGVRGVPRGPREATRKHPAGLTAGQARVLEQLARGLSNADIARELFLSPRTVDHHVSAILARLDVTTRAAAIAAAHERRLLVPE